MIGRSTVDLSGSPIGEQLQGDQQDQALAIGTDFESGDSDQKNWRFGYRRPDGSLLTADVSLQALRSADGELQYVLGFIEDVTDRIELARRLELDDLVATTSARFIDVTPNTIAAATNTTLEDLGTFFQCSRVDLIENDTMGRTIRLSSVWCGTEDAATRPELLPVISDVTQPTVLDDIAGFGSVAVVPIVRGDRISDQLILSGIDRSTCGEQELQALAAIGNLLAGLHARVEAQIYLDVAFEDAPVGISVRAADSTLLAANQAYADFLGYESPAEMIGAEAASVVAPAESGLASNIPQTVGVLGTFLIDRMNFVRQDGTPAIGRVHAKRVPGLAKDEVLTLSHIEDLTTTAINEKALEVSQQRFRDLVENSPAITMLFNREMEITYASPSIAKIGWDPEQLEGKPITSLPPEAATKLLAEVEWVVAHGRARHFDWAPHGVDGDQWLRVAAVPETDTDGSTSGVILVAVDDSARRKSQSELMFQAHHDLLTGLANRKSLLDHLEQALNKPDREQVTLFFLDIDRFKVVNDSLGHGAGDELIQRVAQRLREAVRSNNLVARFGGDEFVIVVDGPLSEDEALSISKRIHDSLADPILIDDHELYVTVSVGIAFSYRDDAEQLISNADAAMYEAKDGGRNRTVVHTAGVKQLSGERFRTESELRRALPRGEFEPFFQAEVDLETGELLGGEALIRWHHPERGLLAAGQFVEIAEECGLITDIGDWVMNQACEVLRDWQSDPATAHLSMRVNLSANQLSERDVIGRVTRALADSGADASGLCLEITETVLMADAAASLKVLRQLRDLGLTLAVDDFGTGYSSLAYLKQFPVNILKIDRSFVDGLPFDGNDLAIVKSIIGLATALGLDLVAEGVETEAQGTSLLTMGCKRAQGYFYGRPIPRPEFETNELFAKVLAVSR